MPTHSDGRGHRRGALAQSGGQATEEPTPRELAAAEVTRLTVNIGPATAESLQFVVQREGVTITEALRRLVSYGDLLYRTLKVDKKDVLFREGDETQQILIP
jgi:hypothetical protein